MSSILPYFFSEEFQVSQNQMLRYLEAVGGGHPVHTSSDLARKAGFRDTPLPGVLVEGAALAAFTRQFAESPIQLARISAHFVLPVYPGQTLQLELKLQSESVQGRSRNLRGLYAGQCKLLSGERVMALELDVRVVPTKHGNVS